jgi:hypothetical protein
MKAIYERHDAEIRRVLPGILSEARGLPPAPLSQIAPAGRPARVVAALVANMALMPENALLAGYRLCLHRGLAYLKRATPSEYSVIRFTAISLAGDDEIIGFDLPANFRVAAFVNAARKGRARTKLCTLVAMKCAIDEGRIHDFDDAIRRMRRLFDAAMISVGLAQFDIGLRELQKSLREAAKCTG